MLRDNQKTGKPTQHIIDSYSNVTDSGLEKCCIEFRNNFDCEGFDNSLKKAL